MGGASGAAPEGAPRKTPLYECHVATKAKLVPFADYLLPVQYPSGILAEHLQARASAALFDVSHMGQLSLWGDSADEALERLVPGDLKGLAQGRMRYTQFTNEAGGILDDLMVTRLDGRLYLIVNAARKAADIAHLKRGLGGAVEIEPHPERALIALQGPRAAAVLERHARGVAELGFLSAGTFRFGSYDTLIARSGYTGEDGFEISLPAEAAVEVWRALESEAEVKPAGLGARDSLRLEAGLCLYGHDIDETTSPIEAGLAWSIGKRRRADGGFPGAARIQAELAKGPARRRVGLKPEGRAPAREGTVITDQAGQTIGTVTSGGFGPSVNGPIAMGYVGAAHAAPGRALNLIVRGEGRPATVVPLPFVPHRYHRS